MKCFHGKWNVFIDGATNGMSAFSSLSLGGCSVTAATSVLTLWWTTPGAAATAKPSDKYRWAAPPLEWFDFIEFQDCTGCVSAFAVTTVITVLWLCYYCVITVLTSVRQVAELHWMSRGIGLNGQIKQNIRCPFFWSDVTWWMSHMVVMFLVRGQRRLKGGQYKQTF